MLGLSYISIRCNYQTEILGGCYSICTYVNTIILIVLVLDNRRNTLFHAIFSKTSPRGDRLSYSFANLMTTFYGFSVYIL